MNVVRNLLHKVDNSRSQPLHIDDDTTTLDELERTMLQPNDKVCGVMRKSDSEAVVVELLWDAEDAANDNR